MGRAAKFNNQGDYMALFTMSFSIAHIFAHNTGMQLIAHFGYDFTWYIMGVMLLVSLLFLVWLRNIIRKEEA